MAGIAVNIYMQAKKFACFMEGAVIHSHIWHIIYIPVPKVIKIHSKYKSICNFGFDKELLFVKN